MKITFTILATLVAAFLALSQANAESPTPIEQGKTLLVQVNGTTVAILPANPARTISVACSGNATYDKAAGIATFTNNVKLVSSVPDQASVTITGENLTVLPQK